MLKEKTWYKAKVPVSLCLATPLSNGDTVYVLNTQNHIYIDKVINSSQYEVTVPLTEIVHKLCNLDENLLELLSSPEVSHTNYKAGDKFKALQQFILGHILHSKGDIIEIRTIISNQIRLKGTSSYGIYYSVALTEDFDKAIKDNKIEKLVDDSLKSYGKVPLHYKTCNHEGKYINVLSPSLKFWYCPKCKKDLGDA